MTSVSIASVVADANVLLSAVAGKAALRVFTVYFVTVHVARFNVDEVLEYIPEMAIEYKLPAKLLEMQLKLLPLHIHPLHKYHNQYRRALKDLSARDPEDAHALALARHLRFPLWSNDRDLCGLNIQCYSTAALLAALTKECSSG